MPTLPETIAENHARYLRQLRGEELPGWDYCVLTAANEGQARGYELEIERRRRAGWLPEGTHYLVVPDLGGRRIGSGGAAAYALRVVASHWQEHATDPRAFPRVLLINSGGDSKRIPHCTATGKAFLSLPFPLFPGGPYATAFDEMLISVCGLPERLSGGIVILSGDVLLAFEPGQFHPARGVTGLAALSPWQVAAQHGVYVCPPGGGPVQEYLQKPTHQEMQAAGALCADHALLDTGLLAFDIEGTLRLAGLAGVEWTDHDLRLRPGLLDQPGAETASIDVYLDICFALVGRTPEVGESLSPAARRIREQILAAFSDLGFSVSVPDPVSFIHLGTTRQWFDLCTGRDPAAALYVPAGASLPAVFAQANALGALEAAAPSIVEYTSLPSCQIGPEGVVSGVGSSLPLFLPPGVVLCMFPLQAPPGKDPLWIAQAYGIDDNPKAPMDPGSTTFFGQILTDWLEARAMSAADLWPGVEPERRSLWNARLFVPGDAETTLRWALWLKQEPTAQETAAWRALDRVSFEEALLRADPGAAYQYRCRLRGKALAAEALRLAASDENLSAFFSLLSDPVEASEVISAMLSETEREESPFRRARLYQAVCDLFGHPQAQPVIASDPGSPRGPLHPLVEGAVSRFAHRKFPRAFDAALWLEDQAFGEISGAVAAGLEEYGLPEGPCRLEPGRSATVHAPARIDFGGGWSDTPPFSLEHGGAVLNAAILLDGARPIVARGEVLAEPIIEIASVDGAAREIILDSTTLVQYGRPGDPLALHKAALVLAGLAGPGPGADLPPFLRACGGGLRLETSIDLPQGSGLGTSSIAAMALLRCLDLLQGRESPPAQLCSRVLYLEQMLTTGGGWQDQLGGMFPGIKLLETDPGLRQEPRVTPVRLSPEVAQALRERLLVCFVGERRVAKNILHQIVRRYLSRAPEVVSVLHEIKQIARDMKAALEAGDLEEFGRLMFHHWELNKRMDRQSTTEHVERLFAELEGLAGGAKLAGAGGGGFMEIVAKDAEAAERIRARLEPLLASAGGRFYQVDLDPEGVVWDLA